MLCGADTHLHNEKLLQCDLRHVLSSAMNVDGAISFDRELNGAYGVTRIAMDDAVHVAEDCPKIVKVVWLRHREVYQSVSVNGMRIGR